MSETNQNVEYISIHALPDIRWPSNDFSLPQSETVLEAKIGNNYTTKKITFDNLVSGLYETVFSDILYDKYKLSAGDHAIADAGTYVKNLSSLLSVNNGSLQFQVTPTKINEGKIITETTLTDALSSGINYVSIHSDSKSSFTTYYHSLENNNPKYEVIPNARNTQIDEAPATDSDKHNRYLFKITEHTSNTYVCGTAGWFTCYGWVSEKETYAAKSESGDGIGRQDNSKRWAALEGNFGTSSAPKWKILQVQPVLPGNYCNYISFSLPVRKNLELRIVTGFNVGKNSGKWSNVPGSLTNHIPNAFIGGIYA